MAEAELEAWEAESVCNVSRRFRTTRESFNDVMPTAVSQPILEFSSDKQTKRGMGLPTSRNETKLSPCNRYLTNSSSYRRADKSHDVEHVSFVPAEPILEGTGSQRRTCLDKLKRNYNPAGEMQSVAPGLSSSLEQPRCAARQEPVPCHANYAQQTSPSVEASERY